MLTRTVKPEQVAALDIVQRLLPWREQLASRFGTTHGNAHVELLDVLLVLTAAFYNPLLRSQRMLDALSSQTWMQQQTGLQRIARSTLSDALRRFDPAQLRPLIQDLARRARGRAQREPDLALLTKQIIAADGSYFNLVGEALWALACRRGNSQRSQPRVRLDLQLDIDSSTLVEARVSGREAGNEAQAFIAQLRPDTIYLVDRSFVHFGFLNALLARNCNFVVRLRKDTCFRVQEARPLEARDQALLVRRDELGHLSGPQSKGNQNRPGRTGPPPAQTLRRVTLWDQSKNQEVVLLTDLLEVPAYVIALLYRRRWLIELFLRFLKCTAACAHLLSTSRQGITLQLYVAMIATLLLYVATGQRVSKYSLFWLGAVAQGHATWEQMQAGLARIEREKALERRRRQRLRLLAGALPEAAKSA